MVVDKAYLISPDVYCVLPTNPATIVLLQQSYLSCKDYRTAKPPRAPRQEGKKFTNHLGLL
ncbi:hypothetical protein [Nostoc sp.]|uniref:hypothetical protein n=1 Tax=Nostoc sp. TaxID=1180 RepID=UPI002FFC8550